jgi:hypothetical protein
VYHYVKQGNGDAQAVHFYGTVRRLAGSPLFGPDFWVIDWEQGDKTTVMDFANRLRKLVSSSSKIIGYAGVHSRTNGGYGGCNIDAVMVPDYGPSTPPTQLFPPGFKCVAWQYTDGAINGTSLPSNPLGIGGDVSLILDPKFFGLKKG